MRPEVPAFAGTHSYFPDAALSMSAVIAGAAAAGIAGRGLLSDASAA
jgi:hypothetical protein